MVVVFLILKMNKITKVARGIVESIWFAAAIMCLFITVKECLRHNYSQALLFAALTLAALFFFLMRRNQRKNAEKEG